MYLRVLTRNERSTVKMQLVWEETFPQRRAIGDWLEQARRKISVAKSGTEMNTSKAFIICHIQEKAVEDKFQSKHMERKDTALEMPSV